MKDFKRTAIVLVLVVSACGKGTSPNGNPTPPDPGKATLVFPALNSACTSGTVISNTQSTITFTWNTSANTDTYELDIKNLLTNTVSTQTTPSNTLAVTLLRGTPYSWYIVSKSNASSNTTASDTWKFYNAGFGIVTYAPFPAAITAPAFGQAVAATGGTVNLTWSGSDVDNDIVGYDVYFGIASTPPLYKSAVTDMFLNSIAVTSKTTYYWKVITKDSQGNTSDSGVYQFSVN